MGQWDIDLSALETEFKAEVKEHIQIIAGTLMEAGQSGASVDNERINQIFRSAHTIKGSARMMGKDRIGTLGHKMEDLLGLVRSGGRSLDKPLIDLLLQGCDQIERLLDNDTAVPTTATEQLIERMEQLSTAPAAKAQSSSADIPVETTPAEPAKATTPIATAATNAPEPVAVRPTDDTSAASQVVAPDKAVPGRDEYAPPTHLQLDDTIRLPVADIESVVEQSDDLLLQIETLKSELVSISQKLAEFKERVGAPGQAGTEPPKTNGSMAALTHHAEQVVEQAHRTEREFSAFHRALLQLRLLPLSGIKVNIQRNIRYLSQQLHKEVQFTMRGEDVRVDRQLLQMFWDIALHLVRNSLDHGIETAAERLAAGKPATGQIEMTAQAQGNQVILTFRDDGRGIDVDKVKAKAVQMKLISEEQAQSLSHEEALRLIFLPRFSMAKMITDISGRGVGLDVIQDLVRRLHGTVSVESWPGKGTMFRLVLPLTMATMQFIIFSIGGIYHALPDAVVEGIIDLMDETIYRDVQRTEVINWGDHIIPLKNLAYLLYPGHTPQQQVTWEALVVKQDASRFAFAVEKVIGLQQLVVKSLPPLLAAMPWGHSYGINADGALIFLLDPAYLLSAACSAAHQDDAYRPLIKPHAEHTILVVDDSLTTREVERTMLIASGYQVLTAADGQEALQLLQRHPQVDLMMTDVEMPVMGGFELTQRVRQSERWHDLPIVIVTALDKPAERRRGLEVGAQAYITKQSFQQGALLDVIERLVG